MTNKKCLTMNTSLWDSPKLAVSPLRVCQNQEDHVGDNIMENARESIYLYAT